MQATAFLEQNNSLTRACIANSFCCASSFLWSFSKCEPGFRKILPPIYSHYVGLIAVKKVVKMVLKRELQSFSGNKIFSCE